MSAVLAIAKRDFRSMTTSPLFFVFVSISTIIWSFFYLRMLFNFAGQLAIANMRGATAGMNINYQLFSQHISSVHFILILIIPAMTMRLLSEEKKQRTYDLLLTAPITATQIALGKFLGGFAAVLILIFIAFLYPAATAFFASFAWAPLLTAFLGLILASAVYVAVGLFASSLTESAMLSVIMGVLTILALWFFSSIQETADNAILNAVMSQASIGLQLSSFLKGTISISAIVFFLSTVGFFIFLSQRVVESSRWR